MRPICFVLSDLQPKSDTSGLVSQSCCPPYIGAGFDTTGEHHHYASILKPSARSADGSTTRPRANLPHMSLGILFVHFPGLRARSPCALHQSCQPHPSVTLRCYCVGCPVDAVRSLKVLPSEVFAGLYTRFRDSVLKMAHPGVDACYHYHSVVSESICCSIACDKVRSSTRHGYVGVRSVWGCTGEGRGS